MGKGGFGEIPIILSVDSHARGRRPGTTCCVGWGGIIPQAAKLLISLRTARYIMRIIGQLAPFLENRRPPPPGKPGADCLPYIHLPTTHTLTQALSCPTQSQP